MTEEECEAKLAKLIREIKIEIEKLKQGGKNILPYPKKKVDEKMEII